MQLIPDEQERVLFWTPVHSTPLTVFFSCVWLQLHGDSSLVGQGQLMMLCAQWMVSILSLSHSQGVPLEWCFLGK